jgi:DamX protein
MDTGFLTALDDVDDQVASGLITAQPFSPPRLSDSQLKQLELLQHLSLYSELLILVCAEKGMGKTFIAKALSASREVPDQSLMLEADFSLSYLDILHNLAQFLDLAELADDVEGIEQQVLTQCLQISEEEQGSFLLIVDQADQLSDGVLEDLNQLALLAPSVFHIILLAPLGFENKLLMLAEPQAPFHIMEVEPLLVDEAEVLLLEQFPDKEWSAEQVDYIVQQSVGNPGKILYLAQQIVSGVKQQEEADVAKFPVTHIAALILVASALLVAYFYKNSGESVEVASEAVVVEAQANIQPAETLLKPSLIGGGDVPSERFIANTEIAEEIDFNFSEPASDDLPLNQAVGSEQVVLKTPVLVPPLLETAKVKADAVRSTVSKQSVVVYSNNEKTLLAATKSSFVIQLFGSYSSKNAQDFMTDNATKAVQLRRYRTEHKGKAWHVVIAGPFESRIAATQQSKRLTEKLRQQKPWIRSISPIQLSLKARN